MKYFGTVLILVACATTFVFSNAQESPSPAEEQPPISPDKKWGYIGGDTPKLVNLATGETVIDFFEQRNPGTAPAGEDPELLWAPDSKRFAFNYSPAHPHHITYETVIFLELHGDKWIALHSPADEASPQLAQFGKGHLPKAFNPRRCAPDVDVLKVCSWPDANTAILYAPCYGRTSNELEAGFLFTLKFDAEGKWKIADTHRMSKKEVEEEANKQ
jgi:hypothetical protein